MYKCKQLTDENIAKMLGSVRYNDILTYNLRTNKISSHFYNGHPTITGQFFMSQLEQARKTLTSWDKRYALQATILAVKTVSPENSHHFGDYIIAPSDRTGHILLGNIIFLDRTTNEYVCSPNKWVYLNSRLCLAALAENAMYDFVSKLTPYNSATLQKLSKRHR